MNSLIPELFSEDMPWSTDQVFNMSLDICKNLLLKVSTNFPRLSGFEMFNL